MPYLSRLSGEITIEPPLTWSECLSVADATADASADLWIRVLESNETTDTGVVVTRTGVAIHSRHGDIPVPAYLLVGELTELAAALSGRVLTGWIVRVGEEVGDIARYTIRDGEVITETATLSWPDGSTALDESS